MTPPGAGLTSDALPEAQSTISAESSQAGVSTRNVLSPNVPAQKKPKDNNAKSGRSRFSIGCARTLITIKFYFTSNLATLAP